MSRWFNGLNPEQIEAVRHVNGPMLILAGAGSGKTTVLVSRTGRLIEEEHIDPNRLCVLTFTNKAARELKYRVAAKVGKKSEKVWAGTFHSFGVKLIREHSKKLGLPQHFGIMDPSDCGTMIKEILTDFHNSKNAYDVDKLLSIMSTWRERGQTGAGKDEEYEEAVEWLLPKYLKRMRILGMVDFDGLILEPVRLLKENESVRLEVQQLFDQVMVDEFQDTNAVQMRLVKLLTDDRRNLSVVGDDDQSIYGWRGACVSNILDFPKFFSGCKVVRLERNYRSVPTILNLANQVISKNTKRHGKVLKPQKVSQTDALPELFVYENEDEEAQNVIADISSLIRDGSNHRDIAILYRSNGQGALFEAALREQNIPYSITGGIAFFDRKEIRDAMAYLKSAFRPNEMAFRRVMNVPARGIGERTIERLNEIADDKRGAFIRAAKDWEAAGVEPRAGAAIQSFFDSLTRLQNGLSQCMPGQAATYLLQFFNELGYKKHLEKHSANPLTATKKWRLVELFASIIDRHIERNGVGQSSIKKFIEAMELRDALEEEKDKEDRVQLLTLHACKGLEFPNVYLVGVEEDLLPHRMLGQDVDEERRLFYVGITRAQEKLMMSRVKRRRRHGKLVDSPPSRFLLDLDENLWVEYDGPRPARESHRKAMLSDLFAKLDALDGKHNAPESV